MASGEKMNRSFINNTGLTMFYKLYSKSKVNGSRENGEAKTGEWERENKRRRFDREREHKLG